MTRYSVIPPGWVGGTNKTQTQHDPRPRRARRLLEPGHHGGIGRRPPPFPGPCVGRGAAGNCPPRRTPPFGSHAPMALRVRAAVRAERVACGWGGGARISRHPPRGGTGAGSGAMMSSVDACGCRYYGMSTCGFCNGVIKCAGIMSARESYHERGRWRRLVRSRSGLTPSRAGGGRRGGWRACVRGRLR